MHAGACVLDRLRIEGDTEAPISTLSKGNAQKVALAQAMLADPQLLVLDEPWWGLDAPSHQTLMKCLTDQRAAGVTVLLTEHRPGTVATSADSVYRLHRGRLTEQHPTTSVPDGFDLTLGMPPAASADTVATEGALRHLPGVRRAHVDQARIHLHTTVDDRDTVLLTLLQQGYTVLDVHAALADGVRAQDTDAATELPREHL